MTCCVRELAGFLLLIDVRASYDEGAFEIDGTKDAIFLDA